MSVQSVTLGLCPDRRSGGEHDFDVKGTTPVNAVCRRCGVRVVDGKLEAALPKRGMVLVLTDKDLRWARFPADDGSIRALEVAVRLALRMFNMIPVGVDIEIEIERDLACRRWEIRLTPAPGKATEDA
jgi:hypothetical protein